MFLAQDRVSIDVNFEESYEVSIFKIKHVGSILSSVVEQCFEIKPLLTNIALIGSASQRRISSALGTTADNSRATFSKTSGLRHIVRKPFHLLLSKLMQILNNLLFFLDLFRKITFSMDP